jgi:hypothetical protein
MALRLDKPTNKSNIYSLKTLFVRGSILNAGFERIEKALSNVENLKGEVNSKNLNHDITNKKALPYLAGLI